MTCCPDAHLDNVLTIGHHPQLRIESGHADELCAVYLRTLVETAQRIGGEVVELLLYGLQERDYQVPGSAYPVDDGIRLAIYYLCVFHLTVSLRNKATYPSSLSSYRQ